MTREDGDSLIERMLVQDGPCFIARYGVVELNCVEETYYQERLFYRNQFSKKVTKECLVNAGIFPNDRNYLRHFARVYRKATKNVQLFCVWRNQPFEHFAIKKYSKCRTFAPLSSVYTGVNHWTRSLKGKKVLIVSSFVELMKKQYEKRLLLFSGCEELLPEMDIVFYKSVVSHGGVKVAFRNWEAALARMYEDISKIDFEIVLLSCGAYGLPLGEMIFSKLRKKVVHVGGSLQLLFGIKGKVYLELEHERLSRVMNENWVYPPTEYRPPLYKEIDDGCYW